VPIIGALLPELRALQMRTGRLVFGADEESFDPTVLPAAGQIAAWQVEGLEPISPHECPVSRGT
jgi:hypothetical protein